MGKSEEEFRKDIKDLKEKYKQDTDNLSELEEEASKLEQKSSSLFKEAEDLLRKSKWASVLTWFVPFFFSISIVFGLIGVYLYPSGAPETKAVVFFIASALWLGGAGLVLSYLSIHYGSLFARASIVISESNRIEDRIKRSHQIIEDCVKNFNKYEKRLDSLKDKA